MLISLADKEGGWGPKMPKICWRNMWMVPSWIFKWGGEVCNRLSICLYHGSALDFDLYINRENSHSITNSSDKGSQRIRLLRIGVDKLKS